MSREAGRHQSTARRVCNVFIAFALLVTSLSPQITISNVMIQPAYAQEPAEPSEPLESSEPSEPSEPAEPSESSTSPDGVCGGASI